MSAAASPEERMRLAGGKTWRIGPDSGPDDGANGLDPEEVANDTPSLGIWNAGRDDYVIPPREWLLGNVFCRRFLSSLVADGGVGKTAVRVAQALALATKHKLTGEHIFRRCRVLVVSFEDDRDELRRRVYAVLRHYNIDPVELDGWLFLAAPKGLKLAALKAGAPEVGVLVRLLTEAIEAHQI